MEEKLILLVDVDADTAALILEASAQTGHGVRLSRNAPEAFGFLRREFDHIAGIVIDVDPGTHGLAVLEAMSALHERPPMLVLTRLEESYMEPIARRHGASACLGKAVSAERLRGAIGQLSPRCSGQSCDPWGHPSGRCLRVPEGKQPCRS